MFVKSKDQTINLEYVESIWIEEEEITGAVGSRITKTTEYHVKIQGISGNTYTLATYKNRREAEEHLQIIETYLKPVEV